MGGAHGMCGARRGAYRVLVGKQERKRPLGGPRHRWEDNIKKMCKKWDWGGNGLDLSGSE